MRKVEVGKIPGKMCQQSGGARSVLELQNRRIAVSGWEAKARHSRIGERSEWQGELIAGLGACTASLEPSASLNLLGTSLPVDRVRSSPIGDVHNQSTDLAIIQSRYLWFPTRTYLDQWLMWGDHYRDKTSSKVASFIFEIWVGFVI